MRRLRRVAVVTAVVALLASGARAADEQIVEARTPQPRAALTAGLMNALYLPIRFPVTVVGAFVAGVTGFFTAGNVHAADDVFGLVDGSQVITPAMLEKRQHFSFSAYD
jgi:hypothetical protein